MVVAIIALHTCRGIVFLAAAGFAHPHTLRNSLNLHLCTAGSVDPVVCS